MKYLVNITLHKFYTLEVNANSEEDAEQFAVEHLKKIADLIAPNDIKPDPEVIEVVEDGFDVETEHVREKQPIDVE